MIEKIKLKYAKLDWNMMNLVSLDESVPDNILCLDFSLNSGVPFNFVIHTCT